MKKEILDIAIEKTNALIHAEHCCKELQDAAGAVYCDCAACSLVEQILFLMTPKQSVVHWGWC